MNCYAFAALNKGIHQRLNITSDSDTAVNIDSVVIFFACNALRQHFIRMQLDISLFLDIAQAFEVFRNMQYV